MTPLATKVVHMVRNTIYLLAIAVVLLVFILKATASPIATQEDEQISTEFWPPDMIPHPHIPEQEKKRVIV